LLFFLLFNLTSYGRLGVSSTPLVVSVSGKLGGIDRVYCSGPVWN
jgi:hypothetical protein